MVVRVCRFGVISVAVVVQVQEEEWLPPYEKELSLVRTVLVSPLATVRAKLGMCVSLSSYSGES